MGSSRLPGKILRPLADRPLLDHIFGRLSTLQIPARIVLATTNRPDDDIVAAFCKQRGLECFRGSESDVLLRYYECARQRSFTQIVRLTGDNPFVDVDELARLMVFHCEGGYDYSHTFDQLPVGIGAEMFTFAALERSHLEGHADHHREHVNEYMLENGDAFNTGHPPVPCTKRRPDVRLTVDTEQDFRRAEFVARHTPGRWATTEEAIALCSRFA